MFGIRSLKDRVCPDLLDSIISDNRKEIEQVVSNRIGFEYVDPVTKWTPLNLLIALGYRGLALNMIDQGAPLSLAGKYGKTPLHTAIDQREAEVAVRLIRAGAPVNVASSCGDFPIHAAAETGDRTVWRELVSQGADLTAQNGKGTTAVHIAAASGYVPLLRFIKDKGLSLSHQDAMGNTPLHAAVNHGKYTAVEYLVLNNASIGVRNHKGNTPLMRAVSMERTLMALYLVKRASGEDLKMRDHEGRSLLHLAIIARQKSGNQSVIRYLIKKKVGLNAQDDEGMTPLHLALFLGSKEVAELLLEQEDIQLDLIDEDGETALHYAFDQKYYDLAFQMIDRGSSLNILSEQGHRPLDLVDRCFNPRIAEVFFRQADPIKQKIGEAFLSRKPWNRRKFNAAHPTEALMALGFSQRLATRLIRSLPIQGRALPWIIYGLKRLARDKLLKAVPEMTPDIAIRVLVRGGAKFRSECSLSLHTAVRRFLEIEDGNPTIEKLLDWRNALKDLSRSKMLGTQYSDERKKAREYLQCVNSLIRDLRVSEERIPPKVSESADEDREVFQVLAEIGLISVDDFDKEGIKMERIYSSELYTGRDLEAIGVGSGLKEALEKNQIEKAKSLAEKVSEQTKMCSGHFMDEWRKCAGEGPFNAEWAQKLLLMESERRRICLKQYLED